MLDGLSQPNTELLLILFTWLLTSSNRILRDKASKASIELLKRNFSICKPLLQHFEKVNDPYVSQRLLGIVFGACVKRSESAMDTYRELAEYVYHSVFNDVRYLNIRIYNSKHRVTLPLKNRSKGFLWFFSFLVWFSKIQGNKDSKYILLLDEPGLSLHASAQNDLLRFIDEKLAPEYQVIYILARNY